MMEMNVCVYSRESGSFLDQLHVHEIEAAKKNGILHFGHEHPLMFEDELVKSGFEDEDGMCCNGCGLKIGSRGFSCIMENCSFVLHEFCAYLPKEMKDYPKHPQHPLTLYTHSPSYFVCDVCHRQCSLFCYHCEDCKFYVDLKCASMSILVCSNETHEHDLTAQLYPTSFMCCYCGEKHNELGMSYQCKTCSFWIQEQCYSIPRSIKHDSHVHPLKLYNLVGGPGHDSHVQPALDKTYLLKALCGVCEQIINLSFRFYGCFNCKYHIHIKCSTKKWDARIKMSVEQDEGNYDRLIQFPLASPQVVQNTLVQYMQKICHWKDEESENDDILNHPAHDHPLTLEFDSSKFIRSIDFNDVAKRGVYDVCNACMLPLLDAPLYSCNQSCKFVLHKWCAKLSRELEHPAHANTGHTLILQEKLDENFGFFRCKGCNEIGNGFAYKCNECEEYYLDVRCAALPKVVNYETHDHPLLLKHRRSGGGCISCGMSNIHECNCLICNYGLGTISRRSSPFLFGCDGCNFYIDIKCLILPREVQHWYDEHGFQLTYSTHISSQNQYEVNYHCEFCEEKLKLDKWIYHCSDCDQYIDTECVRNLFGLLPRFIKFGGSYDSPQHIHSLTCIAISKMKLCDRCHQQCFIFGVGFQCIECQIVFGIQCAYSNV